MSNKLSKIEKRTAYTLLLPAVFLVFAIVLGFFIFQEIPSTWTIFGSLLIVTFLGDKGQPMKETD